MAACARRAREVAVWSAVWFSFSRASERIAIHFLHLTSYSDSCSYAPETRVQLQVEVCVVQRCLLKPNLRVVRSRLCKIALQACAARPQAHDAPRSRIENHVS